MKNENTYHSCELIFEFSSKDEAAVIAHAVKIDNPEFVTLEIEGNTLRSKISATTLNSLINTLEDYMACLALAEKIVKND